MLTSTLLQGTGFITYNLPSPLNRISTAICMDLNPFPPRDWRLEDGPYEVAEHCVEKNVNLLVLLNAWLDSGAGEEDAEEPDWSTVSYWTARLRPLWTTSTAVEHNQGAESKDDRTIVVICNRIGIEEGTALYDLYFNMIDVNNLCDRQKVRGKLLLL